MRAPTKPSELASGRGEDGGSICSVTLFSCFPCLIWSRSAPLPEGMEGIATGLAIGLTNPGGGRGGGPPLICGDGTAGGGGGGGGAGGLGLPRGGGGTLGEPEGGGGVTRVGGGGGGAVDLFGGGGKGPVLLLPCDGGGGSGAWREGGGGGAESVTSPCLISCFTASTPPCCSIKS